jgi:hypothetical protein
VTERRDVEEVVCAFLRALADGAALDDFLEGFEPAPADDAATDRSAELEVRRVETDRRRRDAFARPVGAVERGPLELRRVALDLGGCATDVTFEIANRGPRRILVSDLQRGARVLGVWWYLLVPLDAGVEVPPAAASPPARPGASACR